MRIKLVVCSSGWHNSSSLIASLGRVEATSDTHLLSQRAVLSDGTDPLSHTRRSTLDVEGGNEETLALLHGIAQASRRKGGAHEDMDVMIPDILQLMMHKDREVRMAACEALITLGTTNVKIHEGKPPPSRKAVSRQQRRGSQVFGGSQSNFNASTLGMQAVNFATSPPGSPLPNVHTLGRQGSATRKGNSSPMAAVMSPQNARLAMTGGLIGGSLVERSRMAGAHNFDGMTMADHRGSFVLAQYRHGEEQQGQAVRLGSEVDVLLEVNM